MSQPIPQFIPHEVPAQLDPAPEITLSRWERLRERALDEALAWKRELLDWDRERAWLSEFWDNRRREWNWLARGTNQAWGFVAVAFWERISRNDIEELKRETNVAGKTAPNTFALVIGAGVTLWIGLHLETWHWPLIGIGFIVLQGVRILLYLGSPMKVVEPVSQTRRRRSGTEEESEEEEWI
jgi:hypothetical protein